MRIRVIFFQPTAGDATAQTGIAVSSIHLTSIAYISTHVIYVITEDPCVIIASERMTINRITACSVTASAFGSTPIIGAARAQKSQAASMLD